MKLKLNSKQFDFEDPDHIIVEKVSNEVFIIKQQQKGSNKLWETKGKRPCKKMERIPQSITSSSSLEGDEPGGVGSTNTRPTVLNRLVRDGELSQVVTNHLRLDLDLVEGLPVVHTNDASNHLWDNDHVPQVGSHWLWLLSLWCLPFLFINPK